MAAEGVRPGARSPMAIELLLMEALLDAARRDSTRSLVGPSPRRRARGMSDTDTRQVAAAGTAPCLGSGERAAASDTCSDSRRAPLRGPGAGGCGAGRRGRPPRCQRQRARGWAGVTGTRRVRRARRQPRLGSRRFAWRLQRCWQRVRHPRVAGGCCERWRGRAAAQTEGLAPFPLGEDACGGGGSLRL